MELYIHIPFCVKKCRYCDFASYAGMQDWMERYIEDLLREAEAKNAELGSPTIETVFIGGGTPSILPTQLFYHLLDGLTRCFQIQRNAEWTCEANPGTLTADWVQTAAEHGVNRLSLGMQAAQSELLCMLGRIHTLSDVEHSLSLARCCGIQNVNLDLMFGLPGQTIGIWMQTLETAISLQPQHISCYGLIPEEGTPLKDDLDHGVLTLPDEDTERQMYDIALSRLKEAGFAQYEISNFALPGYACRHNLGYWKQDYYLGLGASAASMLPASEGAYLRKTNPSAIPAYHAMINGESTADIQLISREEAMFETLMLGLRMTEGVDEVCFQSMHGISLDQYRGRKLDEQIQKGLIEHRSGAYRLTRRGMDIQNSVLVDLMDP